MEGKVQGVKKVDNKVFLQFNLYFNGGNNNNIFFYNNYNPQ